MYKVTFEGLERTHDSLLPALEQRKHVLALCPQASHLIFVWEHDGTAWKPFDTDKFLAGLAKMLAPA